MYNKKNVKTRKTCIYPVLILIRIFVYYENCTHNTQELNYTKILLKGPKTVSISGIKTGKPSRILHLKIPLS